MNACLRLLLIALLALLPAQGALADAGGDAKRAATAIRASIAAGRYEQLYDDQTSSWMKQRVNRQQFIASLQSGRAQMGPIVSETYLTSALMQEDPQSGYKGEIYSFDYKAKYAQASFYERIVVIRDADGAFRLSGLVAQPAPPD